MKKSRTPQKTWALSLLTAAIYAPTFSPIYAQTMPETEAELPEVSISAARASSQSTLGLNATTTDLQAQGAASSDSARLLQGIPGVSLRGAGGLSSLPAIHGLADDRLRIKVDGMDLIAACPNHMNPALSALNPSEVAQLDVYAGIAPVSVGGDSIGGSIVVQTPAPVFAAAGESSLQSGKLGGFYRSNGKAIGAHVSATYATQTLSATYSAAGAQAHNYHAASDFKNYDTSGRPGHDLARDEVGSSAYKSRNQALGLALKNGGDLFQAQISYQDQPYQLFPNQRMDALGNEKNAINLSYRGVRDWGTLEARLYHERVQHYMDFGADKQYMYGTATGMPMYTKGKNTGASLQATIDLAPQDTLRLGAELQRYRLDDWWPSSPATLAIGMMSPDTFLNINHGKRDRNALFIERETRRNAQWLSLMGVRYERVHSSTGAVQGYNTSPMFPYAMNAAAFNASERQHNDNNFDISALARYTPDAERDIEFGFARKVRSPNLYERYSWSKTAMTASMNNFVGDGNGYFGDPQLKAEKAHTLAATLDWHNAKRSRSLKVTPYYTHVEDYIDAVRCAGSGMMMGAICGGAGNATAQQQFVQLQYANQRARLYGFDIAGEMPLAQNAWGQWGLQGQLNYTHGKNLTTGGGLYNIMPLQAKLTLTQAQGAWQNALDWTGVRAKRRVSGARNEVQTPGYGLLNARAAYVGKSVRIDFGIENLLNKAYAQPLGGAYLGQGATMGSNREMGGNSLWGTAVPGMGRSAYVGFSLDF